MTNLGKKADRIKERAERLAELQAVKAGKWPRDSNDLLRWFKGTAEYAAQVCQSQIDYLDDLEMRIARGDEDLKSFEKDITPEAFKEGTGREPVHDDLDRCNCPEAGKPGHLQCGWCHHNLPVFMCERCLCERTNPSEYLRIYRSENED